jgi:hypothetical protein
MPYRILKDLSLNGSRPDAELHRAGTVLADWQLSPFVRQKIGEGDAHYLSLFARLTEKEAAIVDREPGPPSWPDEATPPQHLRWAFANLEPEHVADLERRLSSVESRLSALEQSRQFAIRSPMPGSIGTAINAGETSIDSDAEQEDA